MLLRDRVLFQMPKDRELLFPAMAVFQHFVNSYESRMLASDGGQGYKYLLSYDLDIAKEDWELFQQLDLELKQPREVLDNVDMVVDFTEERLALFKNSGKHVCQACGVMAGVGTITPMPKIRQVQPKRDILVFKYVGVNSDLALDGITAKELVRLEDGKISGVVGCASWETYLAASMGLPVIELVPDDRPLTWLSKWSNPYYRVVQGENIVVQISSATMNLVEVLQCTPQAQEAVT